MNRSLITVAPAFTPAGVQTLPPLDARRRFAAYLSGWVVWLVVGFFTVSAFEGVLRYYTASAGMPWAIYVKDVLLILALALGFLATALTDMRNLSFLVVLAVLTIGTIVGITVLPDIRQPLFAAKTWLPLLCGTLVANSVYAHAKLLQRACLALWLAVIGGVFVTSVWRAPWVGFSYDVGGIAIEGSREWTIGDTDRVAGFSRASFDAAMQCLLFGTVLVMMARSYVVGLGVWVLSGAAIYLTLSRSALIAFAAAVVLHAMVSSFRSSQRLAKFVVIGLAIIVVALPFAAGIYYKNKAVVIDMSSVASTSSFEERATLTWPRGLALATRGGNWVTGRGIGGIGIAQQFFEADLFNPGDNLFVYLWGALGAIGAALLALLPLQVWRTPTPLTTRGRGGLIIVGVFLALGIGLNAIEQSIASLFLGLALVWLTARQEEGEA